MSKTMSLKRTLLSVTAPIMLLVSAAQAENSGFSNATLNGAYGFWFEGQELSAVTGELAPLAGIARFDFDGVGAVAIERVTARPGPAGPVLTPATGRESLSATYSVEPTGKLLIAIDDDPEFYACVLQDAFGRVFKCILSAENTLTGPLDPDGGDPAHYQGNLAAFEARGVKQRRRSFSNRQLRGVYSVTQSNQAGTPVGFLPDTTIAQFDFDGAGAVSAPIGGTGYLFGEPVGELPATDELTSPTTYSVDGDGFATIGGPFVDPFGNPIGGSFELSCVLARRGKVGACVATQFSPVPGLFEVATVGTIAIEKIRTGDDD